MEKELLSSSRLVAIETSGPNFIPSSLAAANLRFPTGPSTFSRLTIWHIIIIILQWKRKFLTDLEELEDDAPYPGLRERIRPLPHQAQKVALDVLEDEVQPF